MHRFFVSSSAIQNNSVQFDEDISRQIVNVLRLKPDTRVLVLDGLGNEFLVNLNQLSSRNCSGDVLEISRTQSEPASQVTLYVGLTQREKFEWVLQKCTEIGVAGFVPVISSRSLVQSAGEVLGKYERWQKIIREAAEQSHRGLLPKLQTPLSFADALKQGSQTGSASFFLWEEAEGFSLRQAVQQSKLDRFNLFVGPEGGFSHEEAEVARACGVIPVTLGKRILRMETAALVACALVLNECGDMD